MSSGKSGSLLPRLESSNFSLRRIRVLASGRFPCAPPRCWLFRGLSCRRNIFRLARHLIEKTARHRLLRLAPFPPGEGERKRETFASTRHADVTQPPLLVDRRIILGCHRPLVR